ncbi:MAG: hypothetical protein FJX33_07060 [Alphaproteobacteria bacterium]|nr:hypothetical protein [Alphaproteobacteria bacterium]
MSMTPAERDAALLLDMLTWAGHAADLLENMDEVAFRASELHQAAVTRCVAVVGEAAGRLSLTLQDQYPHIPGHSIIPKYRVGRP